MEDGSVSDVLKKRFQLFGQFFKGFLKTDEAPQGIRADQQVYDDTTKYPANRVLEFRTNDQEQRSNILETPERSGRSFIPQQDPFPFFGMTRSLIEEFEQTMKIFDDFAFILQQPIPGGIMPGRMGVEQETTLNEADEEDARYFKFFRKGNGILDSSAVPNPGESSGNSEENCRDLMLKPNGREDRRRLEHPENGLHSFLGGILGSLWSDQSSMHPGQSQGEGGLPSSHFGSGGYFSFTTQESSLRSDGSNFAVTATKIRETPEGREVITYKTNEDGVMEETREFIPRKDLPKMPQPHFGGIFRPRL